MPPLYNMEEIWKDIEGYEGIYQVSSLGRVKSFLQKSEGKILKPSKSRNGYLRVVLSKDSIKQYVNVHKLVGHAFHDNPDNLPVVMHLDDNRINNSASNLKWGTYKDNIEDCIQKGRFQKGSKNGGSVLTEDQVLEIRSKFTGRYGENIDLSIEYGVSKSAIKRIKSGKAWKGV